MITPRLTLGLLIAGFVFLVLAVLVPKWHRCANLYTDCPNINDDKSSMMAVIALYTIGLVAIAIALILEFIYCCATTVQDRAAMNTARIILLFIGVAAIAIALLVFTGVFLSRAWSYLAATVGGVLALQVAILTLMNCQCACYTSTTTSHVTHHRVVS